MIFIIIFNLINIKILINIKNFFKYIDLNEISKEYLFLKKSI